MKRMIACICMITMMSVFFVGCTESTEETTDETTQNAETVENKNLLSGKHHVEIVVKEFGTIKGELDADVAPITVTNFVNLAKEGFYDGLTFHRIISGFMIQGGDGSARGDTKPSIKGEFAMNGVKNSISHKRGVISMARTPDNDSATTQFFIMHQTNESLDGRYAAFGKVTEGMEVVDKICEKTEVLDTNGTVAEENQPVIESVKITD